MNIVSGDIIAFSGSDWISTIIKLITRSNISHVGLALSDTKIIESAVTGDQVGVKINSLPYRIATYKGSIWRIRLADQYKIPRLIAAIKKYQGVHYDLNQAIKAGLSKYLHIAVQQNSRQLFCSELITTAMIEAEILPSFVNPSLTTPKDLVELRIYSDEVLQLKGKPTKPKPFNTKI